MNVCLRFPGFIAAMILGSALRLSSTGVTYAQSVPQFQQTYSVGLQEPVSLNVDIESGQLQILYSRDGQVTLTVSAPGSYKAQANIDHSVTPMIEQDGNRISIRVPGAGREQSAKTRLYRLDVPYRTEVVSRVGTGRHKISGIMGPVRAVTESGDTRVGYVSQDVAVTVRDGNLDLNVIGGRILAQVHRGNISCTRAAQGIDAESDRGDITLMAIGPSSAKVREGSGRIEVSGARSSFVGSTDGGDIHVKAMVHDNWKMNSNSGDIRIELPSDSSFLFDASTAAGKLRIDRNDLQEIGPDTRHTTQAVNSGGKRIQAQTESGQVILR